VSKHTTCSDVDEGGVERLVEVPVCRCRRRDVDVGAVLFGTNKARRNQNPNTHINSQKFGAKRTHQCSKFGVKRGVNRCMPALAGLCRGGSMAGGQGRDDGRRPGAR
jgi:hypothetical protein